MLKLGDLFLLPQTAPLVEQIIAGGPGLVVVAGLDPRETAPPAAGGFLPSGRATIFRILMREMVEAHPAAKAIVVAEDKEVVRIPRQLRSRVSFALVAPPYTYANQIAGAAGRRPDLLVIDRLCAQTASAALDAAHNGVRVLSQLDTVLHGAGVARHLLDLGAQPEHLGGLAWVLAVQRLAALCPHCKRRVSPSPAQMASLRRRHPDLDSLLDAASGADAPPFTFFRANGCSQCRFTGRQGDVAVFDIFHAQGGASDLFGMPSALPAAEYVLRLVQLGHVPLEDVLDFEGDQLRRTYHHFVASEQALVEANAALGRKLVELETANRVLEQRTRALVSLHEVGQALITSTDLSDLAARVCAQARDLCGGDRAILYFLHAPDDAEVLAVAGWNPALLHQRVDVSSALKAASGGEPARFNQWPPGIPPRHPDVEGAALRTGLCAPLIAQDRCVGLMIVHSTVKAQFLPGEAALLQTFAQHAALAIQRAGLIEELWAKIVQLEAAQAELAQKERIERELELAQQVQQSMLPRTFPQVPGYGFAAHNVPARQVGGDFYDVIPLDAARFGVAIADVSDKGMPAALYMALTRSLLLAEARRARSPRDVLASVNQLLLELGEPNMFVTLFYGVVDRAAQRLTYTRAGHDRPLLLRNGTAQALGGQGMALGLFDGGEFRLSEEEVALTSGDRLVLYTDGLMDVVDGEGHSLGLARMQALFQAHVALPPGDLCAAVFADLLAYQGSAEQYDDMTMLVVAVE